MRFVRLAVFAAVVASIAGCAPFSMVRPSDLPTANPPPPRLPDVHEYEEEVATDLLEEQIETSTRLRLDRAALGVLHVEAPAAATKPAPGRDQYNPWKDLDLADQLIVRLLQRGATKVVDLQPAASVHARVEQGRSGGRTVLTGRMDHVINFHPLAQVDYLVDARVTAFEVHPARLQVTFDVTDEAVARYEEQRGSWLQQIEATRDEIGLLVRAYEQDWDEAVEEYMSTEPRLFKDMHMKAPDNGPVHRFRAFRREARALLDDLDEAADSSTAGADFQALTRARMDERKLPVARVGLTTRIIDPNNGRVVLVLYVEQQGRDPADILADLLDQTCDRIQGGGQR
jgi:hypothetical protein